MNFDLSLLPERTAKPRTNGLTMVMDKGLSVREAEDFLSVAAPYVDLIKLGFGTAYVTPNLADKLKVFRDAGIRYYFGGTLFEAFFVRNQLDDYRRLLDRFQADLVEISDGSVTLEHDSKCELIASFAKDYTVLSEVGSKDADVIFAPYKWIELMKKEMAAGSWKVIAEAREGGNVGIFRSSGEVRGGLVDEILTQIPGEDIIWEAPNKHQQVWFIKLLGTNVNLGNVPVQETLPLETLRLGLRGDTFYDFLPKEAPEIKA